MYKATVSIVRPVYYLSTAFDADVSESWTVTCNWYQKFIADVHQSWQVKVFQRCAVLRYAVKNPTIQLTMTDTQCQIFRLTEKFCYQ